MSAVPQADGDARPLKLSEELTTPYNPDMEEARRDLAEISSRLDALDAALDRAEKLLTDIQNRS